MKELKIYIAVLASCLLFNACYYDVEEELYPFDTGCDTTDVSFAADIVPILQTNCFACHDQSNAFAGVVLETHGQVTSYVDNSTLLGVIWHEAGFSPMPKGGNKLLDCDILKIETWISDGALNN